MIWRPGADRSQRWWRPDIGLSFDNRGIGLSDKPLGPYTTAMFAADTKALVDHLEIADFHLLGVSMGGMIAQEYACAHPDDLRSVTLACTYAAPGPFCSRMFNFWADMASVMGVPAVMRDVTLWAFTPEFFENRPDEAAEFEIAMRYLDQPTPAYLAQLHSIQTHDATARLGSLNVPTMVLAGETDILIPVELSRRLHALIPGARSATTPGGHACLWETPIRSTGRSSPSSRRCRVGQPRADDTGPAASDGRRRGRG